MKAYTESEVCEVRCVARAAAPARGATRLRLSVPRRRWCCWPWCAKKHVLFHVDFRPDAWILTTDPDQWNNTSQCCLVDLKGLRKLQADLPVMLKVWQRQGASKVVLDASLGEVLDQLESCTAPATFTITTTANNFQFSFPSEGLETSVEVDGVGGQGSPGHAGAGEEESPAVEDCVSREHWVTFFTPSGGTVSLPPHTEADEGQHWRGPGAWTSQEDLLDAQAVEILAGIDDRP